MPTLNFKGKSFVQNHHLAVKYHQLVPKKELSLTDKVSLHDNLIIHGDNLAALKALLPTYAGKIKCIYIDPPYNTGNESWAYNDNVNSPMIKDWLGKVVDRDDLCRHDKWLCMMMPRLKLLRELLAEDGAIFISIDDNEQHRLRMLLDEVFGGDNFVACLTIVNNLKGRNDKKNIATCNEFLLIYHKNNWESYGLPLTEDQLKLYKYIDNKGYKYALRDLRKRGRPDRREDRPNMFFPIYYNPKTNECSLVNKSNLVKIIPKRGDDSDGRWRWGIDRVEKYLSWLHPRYSESKKRWDIDHRVYLDLNLESDLNDEESDDDDFTYIRTSKSKSFWMESAISSDIALRELKEIFSPPPFDYPKAVSLIKKIIQMSCSKNDLILDSFAGSGTTAHAVLDLNKEDGGNRKFILIEMEDYANKITAERVRRVIKGVKSSKDENLKKGLGGTFSYFELGKPIEMESILQGKNLPTYEELARYVFYTATGEEFDTKKINEAKNYIGTSSNYEVYLYYKPDIEYLKNTALNLERAQALGKPKAKKRLVFAPAKYLDQDTLNEMRIEFNQLPFEIYRIKG